MQQRSICTSLTSQPNTVQTTLKLIGCVIDVTVNVPPWELTPHQLGTKLVLGEIIFK